GAVGRERAEELAAGLGVRAELLGQLLRRHRVVRHFWCPFGVWVGGSCPLVDAPILMTPTTGGNALAKILLFFGLASQANESCRRERSQTGPTKTRAATEDRSKPELPKPVPTETGPNGNVLKPDRSGPNTNRTAV